MLRRIAILGLTALAFAACKGNSSKTSSGPVIAKGDGFTITEGDFKARIEEQSPFMRARYNTLERKKEFVENLIRFEVLAQEAEKAGYRNDPEVQQTLRKIMVQKLVQKRFADSGETPNVPDADVQKFYDEHASEYHRPKKVRASVVALLAAPGTPDRAKKMALARKALASIQAAEKDPKTATGAFAKAVAEVSEDTATKPMGGDLGLKSADELEKATSKELADAVFALKPNQTSGIVETPKGLYIAKATLVQDEVNRTLEQVKPQIVSRLSREKKAKDFEEWLKQLRETAKVTIDEKALDAVAVSAPPPPPGSKPGTSPAMSIQPAGGQVTPAKPADAKPADPKAPGAK